MKLTLTILFSFFIIFQSCASGLYTVGSKQVKHGSTVELIEYQAFATIEYKNYEYLYKKLQDDAKVQLWTSKKLESKTSILPKGGYIQVEVKGLTIDAANTEWWEYVVQTMEGEEIIRQSGEHSVPNYTTSEYLTTWWNIDIISLNDKIEKPFKVYVIDKLQNKRSGFIVYPNQVVQ
jgi:hypothetical protein